MKLNELMGLQEASKYIGVSHNTLRNWAAKGKMNSYVNPINGWRLYKKEDLDNFLSTIMTQEEIDSTNNM